MMANSTSWRGSTSTLAPTSSTTQKPFGVGQLAAIAGRCTLASMRSSTLEIAISAPVLPAERATCASPAFTEATAFHMLEPRLRRIASDGLSVIDTKVSV
jgi:hypothetical protein